MKDISGPGWLRSLILATTVALLAGCGGTGDPATEVPSDASSTVPATTSPASMQIGPLTFMHDDPDGSVQTWVACGDLAEAIQVTDVEARNNTYPVWSPDGSRIAFDSNRDDPDPDDDTVINDVFTMDPDGGGVIRLTDGAGFHTDPASRPTAHCRVLLGSWSLPREAGDLRDERYGWQPGTARHVAAGRGVGRLCAALLPDGSRLVFTREVDDASSDGALYVVKLDGRASGKITSARDVYPGDADWSPDGTEIVFEASDPLTSFGGVWIVGPDGSELRIVTATASGVGSQDGFSDPVWSPDGSSILVLHGVHSDDSVQAGLATIRPDGTGLQYVGDGSGAEHQADWSTSDC